MLCTHANEFLKDPKVLNEHVSEEDIRISLLDEVEGSLGAGSASKRLSQMEEQLKPIVDALPKNQYGNMGHATVRYALHRLFVVRHGWVIHGLDTSAGVSNASSPSGVLTDQVPAYLEHLFEQRLAGKGFGLHELALLAATIEHLIHNEALSKFGAAFNVHNLPLTSPVTESEAKTVLDTYMIAYILGEELSNMTSKYAQKLHDNMPLMFLAWKDTQKFLDEVRVNVTKEAVQLDFAALAKVAEVVGEQYGSFQDFECRELKDKLVKIEYRGSGRVQLADFYKPAVSGGADAWQFQESVGYLRQLGLLDESDPSQPSVLIANYITSQTNCIASSGFYSVCCKNECEDLLGHLEKIIGSPQATPATISALVTGLPSSTVVAPQELPANLLQRLDEIASTNKGMVPLHGRLFAQWMHHVYPRECSYPHISGTTAATKPTEFGEAESTASHEEMLQYTKAVKSNPRIEQQTVVATEDLIPWSAEEELFVEKAHDHDTVSSTPWKRSLALLGAAGSLAYSLTHIMKVDSHIYSGSKLVSKYTV